MGPTETGLLILLGLAVMAAIAYVVQARETQQRERTLYIMNLKAAVRRAQHLLENIPPLFLSDGIHKALLLFLEAKLSRLMALSGDEDSAQRLQAVQEQLNLTPDPTPHPAGSMTIFASRTEAQQARAIVRELANFIGDLEKKGELGSSSAKRLLQETKRSYHRISHDLELMAAMDTEATRGIRAAAYYFRNCYMKLQKLNYDQTLDRQLYELRSHIDQLADQLAAEENNKPAPGTGKHK